MRDKTRRGRGGGAPTIEDVDGERRMRGSGRGPEATHAVPIVGGFDANLWMLGR